MLHGRGSLFFSMERDRFGGIGDMCVCVSNALLAARRQRRRGSRLARGQSDKAQWRHRLPWADSRSHSPLHARETSLGGLAIRWKMKASPHSFGYQRLPNRLCEEGMSSGHHCCFSEYMFQ